MTVYQGEDGWGGPVRVLIEHGQATAARCLTCGTDDPAETPDPQRGRAGFRPDSDPYLG